MRCLVVFVGLVLLSGCQPTRIEQGRPQAAEPDRPAQAEKNIPVAPGQRQQPNRKPPVGKSGQDDPPRWSVQAAAFSPDGKTLLVGYHYSSPFGNRAMRMEYWRVADGKLLWSWSGTEHLAPILILPGAKEALVRGEKSVQLWDLQKGREIRILFRDKNRLSHAVATPSGKVCLVYAGLVREITAFEVPSGKWTGQVTLPAQLASAVALSPDGRFALCAMHAPDNVPNAVELWSLLDRRLLKVYPRQQGYEPVAFSADGKLAVCGLVDRSNPDEERKSGQLIIWETLSGKERARLNTYGESVKFLADGRSLAIWDWVDHQRRLMRIEWATGRVLGSLELPKEHMVAAISPDERWALSTNAGGKRWEITLSIWDLNTGQHVRNLERPDAID